MRGPKPETLNLSEAEQNELKALVHRHTTPQRQARRGIIPQISPRHAARLLKKGI